MSSRRHQHPHPDRHPGPRPDPDPGCAPLHGAHAPAAPSGPHGAGPAGDEAGHRRLAARMDLFHLSPQAVGVHWHPRGMAVMSALGRLFDEEMRGHGFREVQGPLLHSEEVWEVSGHLAKFADGLYLMDAPDEGGRRLGLKPMNCPGHIAIYASRRRSWRELPIRYFERGVCHRREASGNLNGLLRQRQFCQDDAHIFCRPEQVADELDLCLRLVDRVFAALRLPMEAELSLRPGDRLGDDRDWDRAEDHLRGALRRAGMDASESPGEGAFYGPKIDLHVRDRRGRRWQLGSVQLDLQLPARFGLVYRDGEDGERRPVMIHRAAFGSFERMIGILLEHHAGRLPLWLAPVGVLVVPVSEDAWGAAEAFRSAIAAAGPAGEVDARPRSLARRLRDAHALAPPVVAVIGGREVADGRVLLRFRDDPAGREVSLPAGEAVARLRAAHAARSWDDPRGVPSAA